MPVGATVRQMRTDVLVTIRHQGGRGHFAEVAPIETDEGFSSQVRDIGASVPEAAEDDARFDARLGLVPGGPVAGICVAGAEEHGRGPSAQRVARDRHPRAVEAAFESRYGRFDDVEPVEDPHHVLGALLVEELLTLGRLEA